tara:strand:- start:1304 stop:1456 length:153 start_codon:yes stop_codon:yes gene_type:complete
MEGLLHTIQHSVSHFWCCYWPTIKAMILPGMGVLGTLNIVVYKIKDYLKR